MTTAKGGGFLSYIKKLIYCTAILAVSLAAAGLLLLSWFTGYFDRVLYDQSINNRVHKGPETKSPFIATIDITDASIKELDDANAIPVMDFHFWNEKKGERDRAFTGAVRRKGDAIIAALAVKKGMVKYPYKELRAYP
jgi:hypothetical protein